MFLNKTRAVKPLLNDTTCQSSVKNDSLCMGRPTSSSLCRPTTTCNSSVNNSRPSSSSCKATLQQEVDSDSDDEGVIELCTPSPMISSRPASSSRTQKSLLLANNIANKSSNLQPVPQPATLKPGSVKIPSPVIQPSLPIQHTTIVNPSPNRPPTSNGASFSQKPVEVDDSSSSEDEATPTMLQTNINTQSTRAMIPLIGADTTAGASNGNKNWGNPPKSIKDLSESSSSDSPLLTTPIYVKEVQEDRIQTNMSVSPLNHISPGHSPRDYAGDWDDVPEIEEEELESSATSVAPPAKHNKPNAHSPPKKHDNHSPHHEHIPAKKRPISSRTPPSVSQETQAKTPNKASDSPSTPQSNNQLTANEPARPQTSGNWKLKFEDVELGEKLGSGGFGTVFKARSKQSGETVAVKMCICQDSDMVTAFKREIQMLSQLHHEHVVLFKGACVDPPHLCIVTELMCLGSLYDRLQDEDMDMPWTLRLRWTRDIARGMNYLHTLSPPIVHRDLKSPNVLVNDYYMIKLCDFGMSRTKNHTLVKTKQMGGSPMWMAPECLRGEPFTEKSDVYSFGVVMWEILTREVPWEDKEMVQLVGLVGFRNQTLEIPAHNPGCPNTYLDIMKSCWEAIASDRPSFQDAVPILEKLAISHR